MSLLEKSPSIGEKAWRPSLSLAGVLLAVSACGAPWFPTADFMEPQSQGPRAPISAQKLAPSKTVDRELAALDTATLSSNDLDTKRGGFEVAGLNLSIGLQLSAEVEGQFQVTTNLAMNNAGQWTLVASRTQNFLGAGGVTAASTGSQFVVTLPPQSGGPPTNGSPTSPTNKTTVAGDPATTPITPKIQNQFVITTQPQSSGAPNTGSPTNGPTAFTVVAGDPATTQIVQQLAQNSISTIISNRVNSATVNLQSVLNISINNAASMASRIGAITGANLIGAQLSRH
jgi:hypothetical protein